MSLAAIYIGLRMSLASAFNEHEYFSLDDVMAITGESSATKNGSEKNLQC